MAYGVIVAAVSHADVLQFRSNPSLLPVPQLITRITHLATYWIKVQPLGDVLSEVIDGGEEVSASLWHPLRGPSYHTPDSVRRNLPRLSGAWQLVQRPPVAREVPWFQYDVDAVLQNMRFAQEHGLGMISALSRPFDEQRSSRVLIPIAGL